MVIDILSESIPCISLISSCMVLRKKSSLTILYFLLDFLIYPLRNPLYRRHGYVHPLCAVFQRYVLQTQFKKGVFFLGKVAERLQQVCFCSGKVTDLQSITPCPVKDGDLLAGVPGVIIKAINGAYHMAVNGKNIRSLRMIPAEIFHGVIEFVIVY